MSWKTLYPAVIFITLFLNQRSALPNAPQEARPATTAQLVKARAEAARKACVAISDEYLAGKASVEQVHQWSRRCLSAQREIASRRSQHLEAIDAHVERMRQQIQGAERRYEGKRGPASDLFAAEYFRIEAEIELARAKTAK